MTVFFDRIKHLADVSGLNGFTLSSADVAPGFVDYTSTPIYDKFQSSYILIVDNSTGQWELGRYEDGGFGFFSRNSGDVLASSNSNQQVTFNPGVKEISFVMPAAVHNFFELNIDRDTSVVVLGSDTFLSGMDELNSYPGYGIFGDSHIGRPNSVVLATQGPRRSHQSVQVTKLRTSNSLTGNLYEAGIGYAVNGASDYGVTHIEAIVTAIGNVNSGTTYEALAVRIEAVAIHRGGGVGSSAFVMTPTVTVLGSDGAAAANWVVSVSSFPDTFTIQVTGDANSVIDWVAKVQIVGNQVVPVGEV